VIPENRISPLSSSGASGGSSSLSQRIRDVTEVSPSAVSVTKTWRGQSRFRSPSPVATRATFCVLGLALLNCLVYWPVRHFDFVQYDDDEYIFNNQTVRAGLTWWGFVWSFVDAHVFNWHPVTWISHMLDCQLFGVNAAAHHLVNVALHAVNCALLFLLLRRMTEAFWRSAFVAALFALHPLRVESVAWISERKDVLSGLFFMLTLLSYALYAEAANSRASSSKVQSSKLKAQSSTSGASFWQVLRRSFASTLFLAQSSKFYYVLCLAFFCLGLLSKPMLITVPFVLLLLDFWPLQRFKLQISNSLRQNSTRTMPLVSSIRHRTSRVIELLSEKVPFLVLSVVVSLIAFWSQRSGGAIVSLKSEGVATRLQTVAAAYLGYFEKFFWPHELTILYLRPESIPLGTTLVAVCIFIPPTVLALLSLRHLTQADASRITYHGSHMVCHLSDFTPAFAIGWLWFLIMLVPVCGLIQVGPQLMADRYTYLPSIGLAILVAWSLSHAMQLLRAMDCDTRIVGEGLPSASRRVEALIFGLGSFAAILLLACVVTTRHQLTYWQDTETLMTHALELNPNNPIAHQDLAIYYSRHGQLEAARTHRRRVRELEPGVQADSIDRSDSVAQRLKPVSEFGNQQTNE